MDYILIFNNTHNALLAEKVLNERKIYMVILPTPSYISNSCGISIGINGNHLNEINELILKEKIKIKGIYDNKNKVIINKFWFLDS